MTKTSPKATIFIFGANSILKTIKEKERVFLHIRHGVAKLTQELQSQIIAYVKSMTTT
jgi:hypothetical protein